MNDKNLSACQCHEKHAPTYWKRVVREYKDALEKAEQERDKALADAESRLLTPDAITDEMVERAWTESQEWTSLLGLTEDHVRALITAALTEPPARPEGAEELEADISRDGERAPFDLTPDHVTALADHLAAMGYRKDQSR